MSTPVKTPPGTDDLANALAAKTAELRDLATMGAVITSIQSIDAVLSVVMDMAIRLVDGEVGLIMLEEKGALEVRISWGIDRAFVENLTYREGMDLATWCYTRAESVILSGDEITAEHGIHIDSIICVPIKTAERIHGVMLIVNKADGGLFSSEEQEQLDMLLNFVAVAIDNSRLMQEKLQRQKIEQEMEIARQVQETILPQDINLIPGVEIGVAYYPAGEVGGDFYDLHRLSDTEFIVVVGDVSNKGVPAAMVMSAAAGIIKSILQTRPDIPVNELAAALNDILAADIIKHREMFITLFFAKFDLKAGEISYCNAGHIPGLLWSAGEQKILELPDGGPIVGQFPGITFNLGRQAISSGDRLFLFTDGLTEAEDSNQNLFGRERVEQVFSAEIGLPPAEFCTKVKQWVDRFAVGAAPESRDDFTILQLEVR